MKNSPIARYFQKFPAYPLFSSPKPFALAALATITLCTTLTVAAGSPPDGVYNCQKISGSSLISLGNLEIKGKTYRGIGDSKEFVPFTVSGSGGITWSKGLDGFPEGWKIQSSEFAGNDYAGRPVIKIHYSSPRDAAEVLDCVREK